MMMMMMMTFITRRGEGQGKTKKERKATKSKGSGLEEGASRALMRQYGETYTVHDKLKRFKVHLNSCHGRLYR